MRMSRYLDVRAFCDEARKLKAVNGHRLESVLERLERQRSLIPRLRLRYPDEIERRRWAADHPEYIVCGAEEPDGPRWEDAYALETARQQDRGTVDPTAVPHPIDTPEPRFLPFIQRPAELSFVPWQDFRVMVSEEGAEPLYVSETVVTYYSSWQILQFAEVVNMGIVSLMNLAESNGWPTEAEIATAPRSPSFSAAIDAMRGFKDHAAALDAIVWFAEEAVQGYVFATRRGSGRRMLTDAERDEIQRTRLWAAKQARIGHGIEPVGLRAAIRFLCKQWSLWEGEGRPLIAGAYKSIAARGIELACILTGMTVDEYRIEIGRANHYFKPIMDVIWPDWAAEQRSNARRILIGYRNASSLLQADFSEGLVDRFLDFIEQNGLHGFYWRMESFNRHVFKGNDHALEGLKGDVQGMGVVLEHIASALGATNLQLSMKFKELWVNDPAVLALLKNNSVMKIGSGNPIDLDWFEQRNGLGVHEQTAADLAICYAIRGGAHRVIEETNPLKLERMMLIMLRAAVKTFDAVKKVNPE